ncbi:MAG TPA: peptide deformylase [bacterium]|nr:peptide deformylase [bacterium]HNS48892.1 peptide deformylase [bacterium]
MEKLRLRCYPDRVLKQKALEIANIDGSIRSLSQEMLRIMRASRGVGLAANQVGCLRNLVVIDELEGLLEKPLVLINPRIIQAEGEMIGEEGCLSLPGMSATVRRHERICAVFLDLDGQKMEIEARGLMARIIQHETDHLAGVLYPQHLPVVTRRSFLREYREKNQDRSRRL